MESAASVANTAIKSVQDPAVIKGTDSTLAALPGQCPAPWFFFFFCLTSKPLVLFLVLEITRLLTVHQLCSASNTGSLHCQHKLLLSTTLNPASSHLQLFSVAEALDQRLGFTSLSALYVES